MNIVTICKLDAWMDMHLPRFVHFVQQKMPTAALYLIVPYLSESEEQRLRFQTSAARYFKEIRFVKQQEIPGRLVYFDLIRHAACQLFHIEEYLYVDVDADVLEDLSHLQTVAPDVSLLWVPNSIEMPTVKADMARYGLTLPQAELGLFYVRRSFVEDMQALLNEARIDLQGFAPGSSAWSILVHRQKGYQLPLEYHVTGWRPELFGQAKSIHFTGPVPKLWRPYIRYCETLNEPRRMILEPKPIEYGIVFDWKP